MTQETRCLITAIHECDFICWGNVTDRVSTITFVLFDSSHISRLSKMRSRHTMSAGNEEEVRPLSTSSKSSDQLLDGDFNSYGTNQGRHQRGPEIRIFKVRHSMHMHSARELSSCENAFILPLPFPFMLHCSDKITICAQGLQIAPKSSIASCM